MAEPDASSIAFAHQLDDIFYPLQSAIVWAIMLCLALFAVGAYASRAAKARGSRTWPFYLVCALGLSGFFGVSIASLIVGSIITRASVDKVDTVLSGTLKSITVDKTAIADQQDLFQGLRNYQSHLPPSDHGQPLPHLFLVHIETTAGGMDFLLRRNANHAHEYWLYDPTYKMTVIGPIGHIETRALDAYL